MRLKAPEIILTSLALRELEASHAAAQPPLMERAGQAAAGWALALLGENPGPVLVLAGPGNNGGDGFVLARELQEHGLAVVLACRADSEQMPADARLAREHWLRAGGQIVTDFLGTRWALAVDALFGIGLKRPLAGVYAEWVERLNALDCPVLALDLPSGLDADSGCIHGPVVRATHTATFIAHKPGLLTLDGPDHCGQLRLFDLELSPPPGSGQLICPQGFASYLRGRRRNVHKGHFGELGVVGGAAGMLGAAMLAARAGLHLGAGKVFLGLLDAHAPGLDVLQPELMLRPPGEVLELASALVLGPGLGQSEVARSHLRRALNFSGPMLLDADALNLLTAESVLPALLRERGGALILTPHPAEAARLLNATVSQIQADRVASARELARRFAAHVLLKGCGSVIAAPDGRWFINPGGHGGMAVGGMGDVLAGLIGALLAQGWPPLEALCAGTHLHTCAADMLAAAGCGPVGLTPSETIPAARQIFNQWLI